MEPILLAGTITVVSQTMVLLLFAILHRGTEGIWHWLAGMIFFSAMMGLYLLRGDNWLVEDTSFKALFGPVWLANVCLVLVWLTYTSGISIFLGLKAPSRLQTGAAILVTVLLTYHTFVHPSAGWRSAWVSLYASFSSALTVWNLFRYAERAIRFTARLVAGVFIIGFGLFFLHFLLTVRLNLSGEADTFLLAREMFLGVPASSSLWVFTLLLMIYQRQRVTMETLYRGHLENERTVQRERQRLRLARDLHDGLSGMITSMRWIAERQLARPTDAEGLTKAMGKIQWLAREANEEVRMLLNKLENPHLNAMKWLAEWRQYAQALTDLHGIKLEWEASGFGEASLGDSVAAVALWRVVKEALQNACVHSGARRVFLTHTIAEGRIRVVVGDDGKGYDGHASKGRGLRNIQERMRDFGGRLELSNAPGLHLTMEVELPLRLRSALDSGVGDKRMGPR